jgi:hypothetical protein
MTLEEYGPFASLFVEGEFPGYLELLHMQGQAAQIVIDRTERAVAAEAPQRWVDRLLADRDWRPHLVACAAFLVDRKGVLDPKPLWTAIDAGSWAVPQLAVTALFVDPGFSEAARARVESLRLASAGLVGAAQERGGKIAASLLEAASRVPSMAQWRASALSDPSIQSLLSADERNGSPAIVVRWLDQAAAAFNQREVKLAPKAA